MIITVTLNPSFDRSLTINNFSVNNVNRTLKSRTDPGGKGINVSKVLNFLDCKNIAVGIAGSDNYEDYTSMLNENSIEHNFILTKGSIRTNIKINDPITSTTTDINEAGPVLDVNNFNNLKILFEIYKDYSNIFVISGSISPDTDPKLIAILIDFLTGIGKKVIVDTSGNTLKEAIKSKPYIIKPNIDELSELIGKSISTHEEIIKSSRELIASGIHGVMVTMGGDGLIYVTEDSAYYSPGISVDVKCTVGAGDAVTAAIAYSIENNLDSRFIVSLAASLGTAAVMTEGSQSPSLDDIDHYMDMVEVIEL